MKKIFFTLLAISSFIIGKGQSIIGADTVWHTVYSPGTTVEAYDSIKYTGADSLLVTWNVPTTNINLQSGFSNVQMCDPCECYPQSLLANQHNCHKFFPNQWAKFKIDISTTANPGVGTSYVTVNTSEGNFTFAFITWPTSVKSVDDNININVYPNPTSGNLKVACNTRSITAVNVVNVVGRKVAKFDLSKNSSNTMSISLDNLTDGIYLLQFTDNAGKVLGVKRITKQ